MKNNRSIPAEGVVPVLTYPDVRAAVAWLEDAFGFLECVRIGEAHRAQLTTGAGAVICCDVRHAQVPPRPGEETHSTLVRVEDVDAHWARARERGAGIQMEPTTFEYGERQYKAVDLAGHAWTFTQTLEDVAPEDWGGTTVRPR